MVNLFAHKRDLRRQNKNEELSRGVRRSSGAYELVVAAVLMGLLGFGLDLWLGLLPILTIVLGLIGFIGASISIFYRYREAMNKELMNKGLMNKEPVGHQR